jgi:uncharacterized Tic20 family protein
MKSWNSMFMRIYIDILVLLCYPVLGPIEVWEEKRKTFLYW